MNRKILGIILSVGMLMISTIVFAENQQNQYMYRPAGAVYAMTNAADGNSVVIFDRDESGMLTKKGSVPTGGAGYGSGLDSLSSQNSLILSPDNHWLLAVNAGSNEISVFHVMPDGLKLVDKVNSGGIFPVSLTINNGIVYVLNAGSSPNITGFSLSHGHLMPLAHSTRSLGSGAFAQVGFDPEGMALVVSNKGGNSILVYSLDDKGLPAMSPVTSVSNGQAPFGFVFDNWRRLLVVEAGSDAVSSYEIMPNDSLQVISGSIPNGQLAACWIARNNRGDVFTANPGSGTISAYQLIGQSGQISLLNGVAGSGTTPLDLAIAGDGRFLYALDPSSGMIDMFQIKDNGSLTNLGTINGNLSIFAQGIAAH
jgi:6-phosphogluconolactonase (cycloisomerase 2 family)